MSKYTHNNVPEEIAKKFPHLQGKKMTSKAEVPTHVLESVEKSGKPVIVQSAQHQAPVVGLKAPIATHPALHKSVVHHAATTTTKPAVVTHHKPAVVPTATITKDAPKGQIHILGKEHDTTKVPVQHHVQQRAVPHLIGQSQVKVGGQVAPKAAFTHENVPEDVHKKFPHLQNKATIKIGGVGNQTTIKSPEKVSHPQVNVIHANDHHNEQSN